MVLPSPARHATATRARTTPVPIRCRISCSIYGIGAGSGRLLTLLSLLESHLCGLVACEPSPLGGPGTKHGRRRGTQGSVWPVRRLGAGRGHLAPDLLRTVRAPASRTGIRR